MHKMASMRSVGAVNVENSESADSQYHRRVLRTANFWRRVSSIYFGYKVAQVKATYLRWCGHSPEDIRTNHWLPVHDQSGQDMYELCVDMRGFLIKAGQFIGARPDFVPEPICRHLQKLQDDVPPMPAAEAEAALKRELRISSLGEVFEWIDLDKPLGSASIAQVHKAKLRRYVAPPSAARNVLTFPVRMCKALLAGRGSRNEPGQKLQHIVHSGETAWDIANLHGVSLEDLHTANKNNKALSLSALVDGDAVQLPYESLPYSALQLCQMQTSKLAWSACIALVRDSLLQVIRKLVHKLVGKLRYTEEYAAGDNIPPGEQEERVRAAVKRANISHYCPKDDIVAVKVQYRDALEVFTQDLKNLRGLAGILSKSEIQFDLVSAVDELSGQVKLEFDFRREARVMDQTHHTLRAIRNKVVVPHSIPGLVTDRVLVMNYLDGVPLTQLGKYVKNQSPAKQKAAFKRIISRVSEAYGCMMLSTGLFHADAHPGNIMVLPGGVVGLIDYGQSKQLNDHERQLLAHLVIALAEEDDKAISDTMHGMCIETSEDDAHVRAQLGRQMFGTAGKLVDPFGEDALLKKTAITDFPKHYFLVLRVVQLIRGLATRMDIQFSTAQQWKPFAESAVRQKEESPPSKPFHVARFYGI